MLLPVLRNIPGLYGVMETKRRRRCDFVAKAHYFEALGLDWVDPLFPLAVCRDTLPARYMASSSMPYLDIATGSVEGACRVKGARCWWSLTVVTISGKGTPCPPGKDSWRISGPVLGQWSFGFEARGGTVPFQEPVATRKGGFLLA